MAVRSSLVSVLVVPWLSQALAAAGVFTGGWCRVSTAALTTHDKNYRPFEKELVDLADAPTDVNSCHSKCLSSWPNKLACVEWNQPQNRCFCHLNKLSDADAAESM